LEDGRSGGLTQLVQQGRPSGAGRGRRPRATDQRIVCRDRAADDRVDLAEKKLACSPRAERLALVEREPPTLPRKRQVELLSLSRSGLYYVSRPVSATEVTIKHAIDEIYTQYPFYDSRRITIELRENRKLVVARETVQRCPLAHSLYYDSATTVAEQP
jgi:hypothetical protein